MALILQKIKIFSALVIKHKGISVIVILLIGGGGYYGYQKFFSSESTVRYVFAEVQKGTLIVSISGSGQVSASNQVDVKSKASGDIVGVYMAQGKEVLQGTLLATIDPSDANRAVRDAETSLETAKLELDKLLEPLDELTLLQAENSLTQAKESKQKADDDLKKAYEDGFNTTTNAFLAMPAVITGMQDMFYSGSVSLGGVTQWNVDYYVNTAGIYNDKALQYKAALYDTFHGARAAYDKNIQNYKSATRSSDATVIESLITETYETARSIADAVKIGNGLIQLYKDEFAKRGLIPPALADTHITGLNSYTGTMNTNLSNLLSARNAIRNAKDTIVSAERSIEEKELSLTKIKNGPDDLDIRAKKIAIQQKEDALATAKQVMADHYVRAPFDGVVAKVSAKKGDSASASTIIATFVTKQRIAEISLNEVDVAKVKADQKVTITFDAIEGLNITGEVAEIDSIGTITQGVVNYGVKIGFDTQDERVKPGMSVSAAIITDAKQNALTILNSAVKQQGETAYVEIFTGETQAPREQTVQIGLSNDTTTEITSGLNEGDRVVTQTITANTAQNQSQQSTGFRVPGITGGGGGGMGR